MSKRLIVTLILSTAMLAGCIKPYTPSVQQGNIISQDQVSQLKLGMSQDDVQYLLGEPILQPTFANNQWDYVYTYQPIDNAPVKEKHVSLFFNNQGQLINIKSELTPQQIH